MKILVTGGAGFIASQIADAFIDGRSSSYIFLIIFQPDLKKILIQKQNLLKQIFMLQQS